MSASLNRVLIVAENASTRLGGEAILPYHYFRLLRARGVDAFLIVHERSRQELEELFADDLTHIRFVNDQLLQKLFYRMGRVLPRRIDEATFGLANNMLTQMAQRREIRSLMCEGTVIHQPIPVSPRFPSLLGGLAAPLVAGPLNGGMEYPSAFRSEEGRISRIAIAVGRSFTDAMNSIFSGKRKAAVVLVANQRTRDALPSGLQGRVVDLPENGVDTTHWQSSALEAEESAGARFVFMGRLVDWKALDIVLDALKLVNGAELDVIGDGPERSAWERHALEAGVTDRVRFRGWLRQDECAEFLRGSCALLLPSIYECGGAVVLEAMAMKVPVIATAWGGPLDYLDASCGILLKPENRAALVVGFAEGMTRLLCSNELRIEMGAAGRKRLVEHFDWSKKIDTMLEIYSSALST
jgi:glycosyltransferase involved in cell wall biosynthesis